MQEPRTYPEGVMSWVDLETSEVEGTLAFYGELFGWTFTDATPSDGFGRYVIASLDGLVAAGIGDRADPDSRGGEPSSWNTYVAVDDAEAACSRVEAAGGRVLQPPTDLGRLARSAVCADPLGPQFRLWQAGELEGSQAVNTPGGWNFSTLQSTAPSESASFYSTVFGWTIDDLGFATMIRVPGYGDHLQATIDPDIYTRQAGAPPGFADATGWLAPVESMEEARWHVVFTVADRDATAVDAERLGGRVLGRTDSEWTRDALVRDPQGAVFTASQFTPPSD